VCWGSVLPEKLLKLFKQRLVTFSATEEGISVFNETLSCPGEALLKLFEKSHSFSPQMNYTTAVLPLLPRLSTCDLQFP
jgi:hypothetical protein